MTPDRSTRLEEMFERIADQPPDKHWSLAKAACGEDGDLFHELIALLETDAAGGHSALRQDVPDMASHLLGERDTPMLPSRLGRYNIRESVGQGGMGWIYLAERDGLGDRVAVKTLHDRWSSPDWHERFAQEQRLLAKLNHRNIARLYDAGVEEGTPWFAMEFVEGLPITNWCRLKQSGLQERLALFRSACEAVWYAHRNLTVHLDLKPSNILVNTDGEVKLLDFGIAKNLQTEGGEAEKTKTGLRLFSLNYAAPEQIRGESLDVQADIHALGVILYELLAGRTPADLRAANAVDLRRYIEEPPQRPSLTARNRPDAVRASKTEWDDLDVLCLTAMHRERARRYETVGALIQDLDRFLQNQPLTAQTDTARYRLRKFVSRNLRAVIATAAMLATLIAGSVAFTVGLIEARNKELASQAETQRINRVMLSLFEGDDSAAGPSKGLLVTTLLKRGVQTAESLNAVPVLQARLRNTFGGLYHKLGRVEEAEPLLRAASTAYREALGPEHPDAIRSQVALALLHVDRSKLSEAEELVEDALQKLKRRSALDGMDMATANAALGKVLVHRGDYKAAILVLQQAVEVLSGEPPSVELSEALGDLANAHYQMGQVDISETINKGALAVDQVLFGDRHPSVGVGLFNLATIQLDRGNYREGERLYRRALTITRDWYDDVHPKTADVQVMLGRTLSYQGHLDEASVLYEQALKTTRALQADSVRLGRVLSLMGDLARDRGDWEKAEGLFSEAADFLKRIRGENHEFHQHQLSNLASVYLARRQYRRAEELLRRAVGSLQSSNPKLSYTGLAEVRLGEALVGQTRYAEAEKHALAGHAILREQVGPETVEMRYARKTLERISAATKQMGKPGS